MLSFNRRLNGFIKLSIRFSSFCGIEIAAADDMAIRCFEVEGAGDCFERL